MERDFMGLSSKESLAMAKEEICNLGFKEIGHAKNMVDFLSFPVTGPKADDIQILNQPVPVPSRIPIFENQVFQNLINNPIKGNGGFLAVTPDSWESVKSSGPSTQLTLFYAGAVCVYDDIPPEKVLAIMSLATNAASTAASAVRPKLQVQRPSPKPVANDIALNNEPFATPPSTRVSSPLSASSHTGVQSQCGSTCTDDGTAANTAGISTPIISEVEAPKMGHAFAPASMIPSVPQARKASLARFLEKRKERVMNSAPYNLSNRCSEHKTSESSSMNFGASLSSVTAGESKLKGGL